MSARSAVAALAVALAGAGCASLDATPSTLSLAAPLDDRGFARCVEVVRLRFGVPRIDPAARLIQSDWKDVDDAGRVARRRASLWCEGARLCVLVEVRHLESSTWYTHPTWTASHGHAEWERELIAALRVELGA